ncbi:hypothetical protein GCM10009639_32810 [Kitasatospora putterlickiae]|uniref:Uncharacterized protein n=1 Tax=Kitasatospora putterlickiae TaxID=221725 RepID=A0ABN1Y530_9ACTN
MEATSKYTVTFNDTPGAVPGSGGISMAVSRSPRMSGSSASDGASHTWSEVIPRSGERTPNV